MKEKLKNTIPNIWASQENLIYFYKVVASGLALLVLFMLALNVMVSFQNPIVIMKDSVKMEFYPSERSPTEIGKKEVEAFTKKFLAALYVWPQFQEDLLAKEIYPFAENSLVEKFVNAQSSKLGKELKSKKLAQAITFIDVQVKEDKVLCRFDRVLKIEGLPLVIPTEVTLSMIQGSSTRLNPMGIYVSGIMEHEGKR